MPRPIPLDDATSRRMRKQRRERTRPEEAFAEFLARRGYRVERNRADLPGRPDIVLPRHRIAIFVHGCFWHGCPRHGTIPRNNRVWWMEKIATNRRRDRRKADALRRAGWRVLTIWEHSNDADCLRRVRSIRRPA